MTPLRFEELLPLALRAILHPRLSLARILGTPTDRQTILLAAALVITIQVGFGLALDMLLPQEVAENSVNLPLFAALLLQSVILFGGATLLFWGGRMFGGEGVFDDCLKTVVWISFILFLVQLLLPVALMISPATCTMAMTLCLIEAVIHVIAQVIELHGFENPFLVFLGVFAGQFILAIALFSILAAFGVAPPVEPV